MSNPLGDLISGGEGGYGSFNRGRAGDAHGMTIDFSDMTLAEVQAAQHLDRHDPNRLFAVGKYQIIPRTMDNAVEHLRLDPNQKFTPELQERIFADYLIAEKRPAIESYIRGDAGATLHGAQKAAAMEWASVDDPDTPGSPYKAYIGVGNNHSSIRANRIGDALNTMRAEYRTDIARGLKPDEAWSAVTHVTVSHEPTASSHASDPNAAYVRHTLEQGGIGLLMTMLVISVPPMAGNFFSATPGGFMPYSVFHGGASRPGSQGQPPGLLGYGEHGAVLASTRQINTGQISGGANMLNTSPNSTPFSGARLGGTGYTPITDVTKRGGGLANPPAGS